MTRPSVRSASAFIPSFVVLLGVACGSSATDDPGPKWYCVAMNGECSCSQLRPGKEPNPGVMWTDRCPAAPCCLLNAQSDEVAVAHCGCPAMVDDCPAKAMETQTMVVATCPPP
jgi:hypothetical protein